MPTVILLILPLLFISAASVCKNKELEHVPKFSDEKSEGGHLILIHQRMEGSQSGWELNVV